MASSGKKRDFEAPPSTGVGLCSGSVNPGHPNLYETTMRSNETVILKRSDDHR